MHKAGRESMEEAAALVNAKRDHGRSKEISMNALERKKGLHRSSPPK